MYGAYGPVLGRSHHLLEPRAAASGAWARAPSPCPARTSGKSSGPSVGPRTWRGPCAKSARAMPDDDDTASTTAPATTSAAAPSMLRRCHARRRLPPPCRRTSSVLRCSGRAASCHVRRRVRVRGREAGEDRRHTYSCLACSHCMTPCKLGALSSQPCVLRRQEG